MEGWLHIAARNTDASEANIQTSDIGSNMGPESICKSYKVEVSVDERLLPLARRIVWGQERGRRRLRSRGLLVKVPHEEGLLVAACRGRGGLCVGGGLWRQWLGCQWLWCQWLGCC